MSLLLSAEKAVSVKPSGIVLNEPVMSAAVASWLLSEGGVLIVGRLHWIDQNAYDALSNKGLAVVSLVVAMLIGLLVRRVVAPAWKFVQHELPGVPDLVEDGPAEPYAVDDTTAQDQAASDAALANVTVDQPPQPA